MWWNLQCRDMMMTLVGIGFVCMRENVREEVK